VRRLSFLYNNGTVQKSPPSVIVIKRIGHKCFYLPQRTSIEPPYPSYQRGGPNPPPINVVTDITHIVHGLGLRPPSVIDSY